MNGVLLVVVLLCFCLTHLQSLVTAVNALIWRDLSQLITESFEDSWDQ